jgi:hypothetical protein
MVRTGCAALLLVLLTGCGDSLFSQAGDDAGADAADATSGDTGAGADAGSDAKPGDAGILDSGRCPAEAGAGVLLCNDFEDSASCNWFGSGATALPSTAAAFQGSRSCRLCRNSAPGAQAAMTRTIVLASELPPGATFQMVANVREDTTNGSSPRGRIITYGLDAAATETFDYATGTSLTSSWSQLVVVHAAPSFSTDTVEVAVLLDDDAGVGDCFFVDDVVVTYN